MAKVDVLSEVTGTVIKICSPPGSVVSEGDQLMILESMKMEIPLVAPEDGTVDQVLVDVAASVADGDRLIVLEVE